MNVGCWSAIYSQDVLWPLQVPQTILKIVHNRHSIGTNLRVLTDASSLKSQLLESVLGCPLPYPIFRKIWHLAKSTAKLYNAETSISQQRAIGSRAFHVREVSSAIDCSTLGDATMFKCSGTNENFRRLRCNALSAPWAIRLTVSRDVLFKGTQQTESMRWICLTASNSI